MPVRRYEDSQPHAIYAGLPPVWMNRGLVIADKLAPECIKLCDTLPDASELYLRQRVRYFELDSPDKRA